MAQDHHAISRADGSHNTTGWAIIAPMAGLIEVRTQWFHELGMMERPDGC
jgi:hypothetical protein